MCRYRSVDSRKARSQASDVIANIWEETGRLANAFLMLIGEYSEEYEIFVVQQAMEAVGHSVDIICPDTKKGTRVTTSAREFHRDDKPIAAICHGLQVLVAVPEVIAGRRVSDLFTTEPEVALTEATYVPIGPTAALRDGNMVTAEGWTALAAFIREYMTLLGTEIVHHEIGSLPQAAE